MCDNGAVTDCTEHAIISRSSVHSRTPRRIDSICGDEWVDYQSKKKVSALCARTRRRLPNPRDRKKIESQPRQGITVKTSFLNQPTTAEWDSARNVERSENTTRFPL